MSVRIAPRDTTTRAPRCDPTTAVTRSLLGYGVVAGPLYVVVSFVQGVTRPGFDLARHDTSLLANGDFGWIQSLNLVVSGLMVVAAAVGLARALGRSSRWAPRLLAGYGVGLVGAGLFRADPSFGFPQGAPDGPPSAMSGHGALHLATAGIGFACLIAACLVMGRWFAARDRSGWALASRATGVVFLAGFVGVAAGSGNPATVLGFWVAVLVAWAWLTALSVSFYRRPAISGSR